MGIVFRGLLTFSVFVTLTSSALAQFESYSSDESAKQVSDNVFSAESGGTIFEKIGKLYEDGDALELSVLQNHPILSPVSFVMARTPSQLTKDQVLTSLNTGDDVVGPILYTQAYRIRSAEVADETYFELLKKDIAKGSFSPLENDEENNALVQFQFKENSEPYCRSKTSLRLTTLEDGRRIVVVIGTLADARKKCNPDIHGVSSGQDFARGYIVLHEE